MKTFDKYAMANDQSIPRNLTALKTDLKGNMDNQYLYSLYLFTRHNNKEILSIGSLLLSIRQYNGSTISPNILYAFPVNLQAIVTDRTLKGRYMYSGAVDIYIPSINSNSSSSQ
jgi:hypothetical protein